MRKLKVFEAFSGYGSQSLELKELGIIHEVVGTSEYEYNAIIAYSALHENFAIIKDISHDYMKEYLMKRNIGFDFKKNKSKIPRMKKSVLERLYSATIGQKCYGDISLINPDDIPDMDLFTYSFPCQDISVAGNGMGFDEDSNTRSSLLWESRKIIKNKKPKFLMMENVKNIIGKKNKNNFEKWMDWLSRQGYNSYYKLINAKHCGIPQNRERVFLVSILRECDNGHFHFEDDVENNIAVIDFMDDIVDKRYYMDNEKSKKIINIYIKSKRDKNISNINSIKALGNVNPSGNGMNGKVYDADFKSPTLTTNKGEGIKMLVRNNLKMIGMLDMKGNESIRRVYSPDGICPTISTCQGGHREPKFIVQNNHGYNKGGVHEIAPTLTTSSYQENNFLLELQKENNSYIVRKLTPRECFRLMGLNEGEIDKIQNSGISNSQQYKLAGNSIVKQMMVFLKNLPYDNL